VPDAAISLKGMSKNMNSINCIRPDGNCLTCSSFNESLEECNQDDDLGGTGYGDDSYSDADLGW
jgi:hypothetical protein